MRVGLEHKIRAPAREPQVGENEAACQNEDENDA